jgi:hypothetical protein
MRARSSLARSGLSSAHSGRARSARAGRAAFLYALLALLVLADAGEARAHEPTLSRYTYGEHVRPLFVKHCGGCHRPGGIGPMSLLDYGEAVPWANAIKLQVLERKMPPFLPGDEGGPFRNARSLDAREIDVLVDWSVGATPEGAPGGPEDDRSPKASSWIGGEPDLVLEPDADVILGEEESERSECVALPTRLRDRRVLSAVEMRPRASTALRRAAIHLGTSCRDGEPLLTWLPDQGKVSFPAGLGRALSPGASLSVELLYVKGWTEQGERIADRSRLGVWFSRNSRTVRSVRIEGAGRLAPGPVTLVALYPDPAGAAAVKAPLRVEAVEPGGSKRLLLEVDSFDPSWREKYFFLEPVPLPGAAEIQASFAVWADFVETR